MLSHLHLDHPGGLEYFRGRDVPVYVQGEELKRAFYAIATGEDVGAYIRGATTREGLRLSCSTVSADIRVSLSTPRPPLSSPSDMSISTNQLKSGNHVEVDGTVYKVIEFQHVNPGKGAAFVRTKLRRASDGAVIDKTFRAGEKLRSVRSEAQKMQFLYADGDGAHFMNAETYDQIALPADALKDALKWVKAGDQVDILFIDDKPNDVQVPGSADLEVTETEPGLRGDTASGGGTKPATLETGVVVQVPLFISEGETIRVDTREGRYLSRA